MITEPSKSKSPEFEDTEDEEEDDDEQTMDVEMIKDPPRTVTTASSSDPSNASKHEGEEGEDALTPFVPLAPIPEDSGNEKFHDDKEEEEYKEEISEDDEQQDSSIIDISKMVIETPEEARRIAEIIMEVLEQDLYELKKQGKFPPENFLLGRRHWSDPALEKVRRQQYLRDHHSKLSLVSNLSQLDDFDDLEQPSTLVLSYEEGSRHKKLNKPIDKSRQADASTQVDLHREAEEEPTLVDRPAEQQDSFCQTKEFTMLRRELAKKEFIKLYPKPDDWKEPIPASRDSSLQKILELANDHDQNGDEISQVGPKPKYKRPLAQRMLRPRKGDYQKQETYWTGSSFQGDFKNRMFEQGRYHYPTLAKYESEFKEGHIHSKKHFGLVTYPRGDTFEGTWRKGRFTEGRITFSDGLKFEPMGWKYCTPPDRRFFIEKTYGVQGVGETLYNDRLPSPHIPYGCYDVGDGVYNPETGTVLNYQGVLLRNATEYEHRWIVLNCRKRKPLMECYEPLFTKDRTPDYYAAFYPKNT